MTILSLEQSLENVYMSLQRDNEDIDIHIRNLKSAMSEQGLTSVAVDCTRLVQNNRQGRKLMQSYFKKRGVIVTFANDALSAANPV